MQYMVNKKIQVSSKHYLYPNRIGYYQRDGVGNMNGFLILSHKPLKGKETAKIFSVEKEYCNFC